MTDPDFDSERDLRIEKFMKARPETIWRCWEEPDLFKRWFTPPPVKVTEVENAGDDAVSAVLATGLAALTLGLLIASMLSYLSSLAWPALRRFRPFSVAGYVMMVQAACAWATMATLSGRRVARWDTGRPASPATESSS